MTADAEFRERMREASVEDLNHLLLETARLIAERKGRPVGLVHRLPEEPVAVLIGIGPFAGVVKRCNDAIGETFAGRPDRAGVIAERKMAELPFRTGGGGGGGGSNPWREGR